MDLDLPPTSRRRPRRSSAAGVLRAVPAETSAALADGGELVQEHTERTRIERRAPEHDTAATAWRVYRVAAGGDEYLADLEAPPRPAWCAAYGAGRYRWIPLDDTGTEHPEAARSLVVGAAPIGSPAISTGPARPDPLTTELVRALGGIVASLATRPTPPHEPRDDRMVALLERLALDRATPAPATRGDASTWQTAFFEGLKLGRELSQSGRDDDEPDTLDRLARALPDITRAFTAPASAPSTTESEPLDRVAELRRAAARFTPAELAQLAAEQEG